MIAVTNIPAKIALNRLVVIRPSIAFTLWPAMILRASVIRSIPNKKRAKPPSTPIMIVLICRVLVVSTLYYLWRSLVKLSWMAAKTGEPKKYGYCMISR